MSAVDWVCKKISLESASEQLSDITIPRQQVLPSRLDACANVTTCCCCWTGVSHKSFAWLLMIDLPCSLDNAAPSVMRHQKFCIAILFSGYYAPPKRNRRQWLCKIFGHKEDAKIVNVTKE